MNLYHKSIYEGLKKLGWKWEINKGDHCIYNGKNKVIEAIGFENGYPYLLVKLANESQRVDWKLLTPTLAREKLREILCDLFPKKSLEEIARYLFWNYRGGKILTLFISILTDKGGKEWTTKEKSK